MNAVVIRKIYSLSYRLTILYRRFICLVFNPFVSIGRGTVIDSGVKLFPRMGGNIFIGNSCEIKTGALLQTYGGDIRIGNHSSINAYTIIHGGGNVDIGSHVRIAPQCMIVSFNHNFDSIDIFIDKQGKIQKGIKIEDDVWIGSGVRVLDGVTISKGCVIGAGSVVTKSTLPYSVYVGIPARMIRRRRLN